MNEFALNIKNDGGAQMQYISALKIVKKNCKFIEIVFKNEESMKNDFPLEAC